MVGAGDRDVAVAGGVDRPVLRRDTEVSRGSRERVSWGDRPGDEHAGSVERSQIACCRETGILVASLSQGGRGGHHARRTTDLEPVELRVGDAAGKAERGGARGLVVDDARRLDPVRPAERDGRHVIPRGVHLEEPVKALRLRRALRERIIPIEMHDDRVLVLHQSAARSRDRLRYDRHDHGPQVEPEVDGSGGGHRVARRRLQAAHTAVDRDPVGVVDQRVGEPDHHLVLVREIVD